MNARTETSLLVHSAETDVDPWRHAPVLGVSTPIVVDDVQRETLFRTEAIEARQTQWMGDILVLSPIKTTLIAGLAVSIALAIIAFLFLGEFTRKEKVVGEVQFSKGAAKVYALQAGVVVKQLVVDGQSVRQGEPMFVISAERSTARGDTQAVILQQLAQQKSALTEELRVQQKVSGQDLASLQQRAHNTQRELTDLRAASELQAQRIALTERSVRQYRELAAQHYMSDLALRDKERELLDAQSRLRELQRLETISERDLATLQSDIKSLPLKDANQGSAIRRQLSALEQSAADNEMRRETVVLAPHDGVVTAILAHPGQVAAPNVPLATVLPAGASLEAHLYAPSRAVGFIREGADVLLRYEAFPYQKFGQYHARVLEVSRAVISPAELPTLLRSEESLYRIRVALDAPEVTAYGKPIPLQSGMRLEADVLVDTRKLYEWMLEPLFSLSGKI